MLHQIMGHQRFIASRCSSVYRFAVYKPTLVVLGNPFSEGSIGLRALVLDKRPHGGVLEIDIPFAKRALYRLPLLYRTGSVDHIGDISPLLTVILLYLLADNCLLMYMFLQAQ